MRGATLWKSLWDLTLSPFASLSSDKCLFHWFKPEVWTSIIWLWYKDRSGARSCWRFLLLWQNFFKSEKSKQKLYHKNLRSNKCRWAYIMNNWVVCRDVFRISHKTGFHKIKACKQTWKARRRRTFESNFGTCQSKLSPGYIKVSFASGHEWRYPISMVSTRTIQVIVELNFNYEHHYL